MAKILLVEDDPGIAEYVETILATGGHQTLHAATVTRAKEFLQLEPGIELALFDYHLGEKNEDGQSLLKAVRSSPRYQQLPVIVCTGDARHRVVAEFLKFRIAGFLRKPFRPERLLADVSRVLAGGSPAAEVPKAS